MKNSFIKTLLASCILMVAGISQINAQKACCGSKKDAASTESSATTSGCNTDQGSTACCSSASKSKGIVGSIKSFLGGEEAAETTSGCTPSSCRGAKTKFGEAKSITELRMQLIDLKAEMETYKKVEFPERTYSVHGIVGETDDESLKIIEEEVKLIEAKFEEAFDLELKPFATPDNKAKQVAYLAERIATFKETL